MEKNSQDPVTPAELKKITDHLPKWLAKHTVITAIALLSFTYAPGVAAQTNNTPEATISSENPDIHYGREATEEEAAVMGILRNSSSHSKCSASILKLHPDQTSSNVILSALHCGKNDTLNWALMPNHLTFSPAGEKSGKVYKSVKVIQLPPVEGGPKPDIMAVVLSEPIPFGNGIEGVELATPEMLYQLPAVAMGYGLDENNNSQTWPKIITQEIINFKADSSPQLCKNVPGYHMSKPSLEHTDKGDSGGFLGYVVENESGEVKHYQVGVTTGPCYTNGEIQGTAFTTAILSPIRETLLSEAAEAQTHAHFKDVPYTITSPLDPDSLDHKNAVSGKSLNLKEGSAYSQDMLFRHGQNGLSQEEATVALTGATFEITEGAECLAVHQNTQQLPMVFEEGINTAAETTFTPLCEGTPFDYHYAKVHETFDITKTVNDGELELQTSAERNTLVYMSSPLEIDVNLLTHDKNILYNEGGITVTGVLSTPTTLDLEISTTEHLNVFYYTLTGIPASSSTQEATSHFFEWSPEDTVKIEAGEAVVKHFSISLPENQTLYIPRISKIDTRHVFVPSLRRDK